MYIIYIRGERERENEIREGATDITARERQCRSSSSSRDKRDVRERERGRRERDKENKNMTLMRRPRADERARSIVMRSDAF